MSLPDLAKAHSFDGIDLPSVETFWKTWHLVTTRYRADNGEQRVVFANELAWKAMQSKSRTYPNGAMFGKVAFAVGDDPSFPNSKEPVGFARVQLMRKDSRAYGRADGWGYALLVAGSGVPYAAESTTVAACHSCHKLVPERDFVFSRPAFLGDGYKGSDVRSVQFKTRFREQPTATLTFFQQQAFNTLVDRNSAKSIAKLRGLTMELFSGSLNESVGVLSRFALEDQAIYALWDEKRSQFLIVAPLAPTAACRSGTRFARASDIPGRLLPTLSVPGRITGVEIGQTCNGIWRASHQ